MPGNKVVIFNKSGQLVKELTFADALLVISMAIIPDAEELWVVSRFKIINKFKLDGTPLKKGIFTFSLRQPHTGWTAKLSRLLRGHMQQPRKALKVIFLH